MSKKQGGNSFFISIDNNRNNRRAHFHSSNEIKDARMTGRLHITFQMEN
jgi:hypothetical protein